MLKVGNKVINLNAIAYVDLEAKKSYVTKGDELGVRIYLQAADREGNLSSLFFSGDDAQYLRKYFQAVGEKMKQCCVGCMEFNSIPRKS